MKGVQKSIQRSTVIAFLISLVAVTAFGRFLDVKDMKTLVAESKLVFVGQVKSVKPSGITTSLSYPTWEGVVFEWLQVDVEVLEPIKNTKKSEVVQVAMLSVNVDKSNGHRPEVNAPGMLEPKKGDKFLFFVAPTSTTNLFAALTAPYDDNQSIFRLDRSSPEYSWYQDGKEKPDSPFYERYQVIWSLVDNAGKIIPSGADSMRGAYAKEISMEPSKQVIYLQWQRLTNPSGWSTDVPKKVDNGTNVNPK